MGTGFPHSRLMLKFGTGSSKHTTHTIISEFVAVCTLYLYKTLYLFSLPHYLHINTQRTQTHLSTSTSSYVAMLPDIWIRSSAGVPLIRTASITAWN